MCKESDKISADNIFWWTKFFDGQIFSTSSRFWQLCPPKMIVWVYFLIFSSKQDFRHFVRRHIVRQFRSTQGPTCSTVSEPNIALRWPSNVCCRTSLMSSMSCPRNCSQAVFNRSPVLITFTWATPSTVNATPCLDESYIWIKMNENDILITKRFSGKSCKLKKHRQESLSFGPMDFLDKRTKTQGKADYRLLYSY